MSARTVEVKINDMIETRKELAGALVVPVSPSALPGFKAWV